MNSIRSARFSEAALGRVRGISAILPIAGMALSVLAACGSDDDPGAAGTAGGSAGVGGTGGVGGSDGASGSSGVGGSDGVGGSSGASGSAGVGGGSTFPPVTDFAAPGPFQTTRAAEGPQCTINRPTMLGELPELVTAKTMSAPLVASRTSLSQPGLE